MSQKKIIWIGLALAVGLLLFVYISGRRAGKRGKDKPLPNNGADIPGGWSPDGIVSNLYEVMKGASVATKKRTAFGSLLALTPGQLTAVYNKYNQLYGEGSHGQYTYTLYNWIADEWYGDPEQTAALSYLKQNGLG